MACLRANGNDNAKCRLESKAYLECRMEKYVQCLISLVQAPPYIARPHPPVLEYGATWAHMHAMPCGIALFSVLVGVCALTCTAVVNSGGAGPRLDSQSEHAFLGGRVGRRADSGTVGSVKDAACRAHACM